ncbi:MAG TPA: sensor histidine kinase [Longimicrobium sp.]|jgi:signal transduction histidine kinase
MDQTTLSFEQYSANRLIAERGQITRTWVMKLSEDLGIHPVHILPHESILDAIPVVLGRAAEFLLIPDADKLTAEQFVTDEMRNIASLRRRQGYEVREIIREFDELAHILDMAALVWVDEYPGTPDPRAVGRVFGRLNRVPLLMGQVTVGVVEDERNELLRRLASAEEQERLRISRELHDQMGQLVTALQVGLKGLQGGGEGDRSRRVAELEQLAGRIAREVHQLAVEMRPPGLDNLGLMLALESMLHEWSDRNGVECDFQAVGLGAERFAPEVETMLYRVAQEALTNVLKHAAATRVGVLLERRGGHIALVIEDDGKGFDTDLLYVKTQALGLRGMRERVAPLGGRLDVESTPGVGTTLFVRVSDGFPPPETDTPG